MTISDPSMATKCTHQHILLSQRIFAESADFTDLSKFFVDITYFCWVITTYLCWLIKFCWHSIFCWISWFLLRQQIFAYSAIFCWVIIRHFDNSASFLLTQRIFADPSIFLLIQHMTQRSFWLLKIVTRDMTSYKNTNPAPFIHFKMLSD